MLIKLDKYDLGEIQKAEKEIGKCKTIKFGDDTYIEVDELLAIIENLNYELEHIQDEFSEFVKNVDDNFKPINKAEQYDISDRDFV